MCHNGPYKREAVGSEAGEGRMKREEEGESKVIRAPRQG